MTQPNGDFTPRTRDGVSLKDYIDEINDSQCLKCTVCRKGIDEKFVTGEKAVETARTTVETSHLDLTKRVSSLELANATSGGMATQRSVAWAYVFSGATLLVAIAAIVVVIILK